MSADFEDDLAARQLREMWEHKTGQFLGHGWDPAFADWIKKFGGARVADAVQSATITDFGEDGERQPADVRNVPKYATVELAEDREPGMRDCYLTRGHMRKKFYYSDDNDGEVLSLLRNAMRSGVTQSGMREAIEESNTLEDCFAMLGIDRVQFRIAMGQPIVDFPKRGQVFIKEEDPEWPIWNAYLRKTTGKGAPMNKHFGWFFPSRLPPPAAPATVKRRRSP